MLQRSPASRPGIGMVTRAIYPGRRTVLQRSPASRPGIGLTCALCAPPISRLQRSPASRPGIGRAEVLIERDLDQSASTEPGFSAGNRAWLPATVSTSGRSGFNGARLLGRESGAMDFALIEVVLDQLQRSPASRPGIGTILEERTTGRRTVLQRSPASRPGIGGYSPAASCSPCSSFNGARLLGRESGCPRLAPRGRDRDLASTEPGFSAGNRGHVCA